MRSSQSMASFRFLFDLLWVLAAFLHSMRACYKSNALPLLAAPVGGPAAGLPGICTSCSWAAEPTPQMPRLSPSQKSQGLCRLRLYRRLFSGGLARVRLQTRGSIHLWSHIPRMVSQARSKAAQLLAALKNLCVAKQTSLGQHVPTRPPAAGFEDVMLRGDVCGPPQPAGQLPAPHRGATPRAGEANHIIRNSLLGAWVDMA